MKNLSVAVLRLRDFRLLVFTRVFGMMALRSQAIIVGLQVYDITRDPFMLGLAGLIEAIPALVCALFAGYLVDIGRPHRVFISCIGAMAINTFMLLFVGGGFGNLDNHYMLFFIYAGIFISGVARSFIMPSSFSLLSQIVSRAEISSASAWMNTGFQLASISGPAITGIIYAGYGARGAWMLPVSLMSMAFFMLLAMTSSPKLYRSSQVREPAAKSIPAGWKFIWNHPVLLSIMALDMFAVLFGGAVAMIPAYADQVLHVQAREVGALLAAPAAGAIFMAIGLALKPFRQIRATLLLAVITGFGLCMIGFGLSTNLYLSLFFLALSGAFDSVSMVVRGTLMQWLTPDAMRGRVSSVNSMFIISSNEIGSFESGLAARFLGLVPSIVFGGACTLAVVGLTAWLSPNLRKLVVDADKAA